jgi:hypothetical protein
MNDTPQTDNLARGNHVVPTEFAQELERERNHAQEGLARAGLIIAQMQKNADEFERERDEAKAEVARLREALTKSKEVMSGGVTDDQGEAWDMTLRILDEALATMRETKEETK